MSRSSALRSSREHGELLRGFPIVLRGVFLDTEPAALGRVHSDVGMLQELFGILAVVRIDGDADTAADLQHHSVPHERLPQRGQNPVSDLTGLVRSAEPRQQHGELVAAEPGHRVVVAHAVVQPRWPPPGAAGHRARGPSCR